MRHENCREYSDVTFNVRLFNDLLTDVLQGDCAVVPVCNAQAEKVNTIKFKTKFTP